MRRGSALVAFALAVFVTACGAIHPPAEPPPPAAPAWPGRLACLQHPLIRAWERRLRTHPELQETRQGLARAARYLPGFRQILADRGVPPTFALLPLLESSFREDARGQLDELGLWQLRTDTARRFGLTVNAGRDERLHPARATGAAARYLHYLHARYRDWPLALAAYNAGEHRVDRALAPRPGASFWELADGRHLPHTSRNYVPRFIAVVRIIEGVRDCHRPPEV
jgi:membrane-bound lytic murein transglycosylase D